MPPGLPRRAPPTTASSDANDASRRELLIPDEHYLAACNPIATSGQRQMESLALRIFHTPLIQKARAEVARRWKVLVGSAAPAEAWDRFEELVEEFVFNDVLKAVNSDPNHPKVLGMLWAPPREWMGQRIPGSRGSGGDGPDNHYALIPIDGHARFEISGRRFEPAPADVPFTVIGNSAITMTLASFEWHDMVFDEEGCFVLTVSPAPAEGRANHLQVPADARYLFVRCCRADWREIPLALSVRRLDPPTAPPLSETAIAEFAARNMVENVFSMHWFMRVFDSLPRNTITPPFCTGEISGLVTQLISFIRLTIADDEAYVATIGSGDAAFRDLVLHDYWFRTIDYSNRQTSLNIGQAKLGHDASTTYVISHQDPGVHNWLDTCGLHELLIVHRWQAMPRVAGRPAPGVAGRLIKFAELDTILPADAVRLSPEARAEQLLERKATYQLRLMDR